MADPEDFKKVAPKINAPDVNDPLQNPHLKHVKSATCEAKNPGTLAVVIGLDPIAAYEKTLDSVTAAVRAIITNAGGEITFSQFSGSVPLDNTNPDVTVPLSLDVTGDEEKIKTALDQMVVAGKRMASSIPLAAG